MPERSPARRATVANGCVRFPSLVQPGLFDKRAVKHHQLAEQQRRHILTDCAERTSSIEATATAVVAGKPQIALLLVAYGPAKAGHDSC